MHAYSYKNVWTAPAQFCVFNFKYSVEEMRSCKHRVTQQVCGKFVEREREEEEKLKAGLSDAFFSRSTARFGRTLIANVLWTQKKNLLSIKKKNLF